MSGDQNNNQNQQKQKGGNQNGAKEGITIATSVVPSQPTTIGQQVQNAVVTCIGGVVAAMACAGVQKGFDWVVGKWTGRKVRPVFNVTPTGPAMGGSGNIMQELHTAAGTNPDEAKRAIQSVAKRLGMQVGQPAPAPVTVDAGVVEMTPPTPAPAPAPAPTAVDVVPSEAALKVETKQPKPQQQGKGGKK